jgi:putative restriction endonuclease
VRAFTDVAVDPDHELRRAAVTRARDLADRYFDLVPRRALAEGFTHAGVRVSFGSFQKGIHRSRLQRGPAALTLTTSFKDPYDDTWSPDGAFAYAYREGPIDQPDNRALVAAFEMRVPVVYFRGVGPGQYLVAAPMYVVGNDPAARRVLLEAALPLADMGPEGLVSAEEVRAYATRDVRMRLHQQRFRVSVLRAYRHRCAICTLRERSLVQAAHIVPDPDPAGIAAVVNGLALCAIHHLAYDRNVLGIDPEGVVHVSERVLRETDGPMLTTGLQGFHGEHISVPRRADERPDPERLARRFEVFQRHAA